MKINIFNAEKEEKEEVYYKKRNEKENDESINFLGLYRNLLNLLGK